MFAPSAVGAAFLMAALLAFVPAVRAADDLDGGLEEKPGEEDVAALLGEKVVQDLDLLKTTHLSMLAGWEHVRHATPAPGETNAPCHWKEENGLVVPLDDGAMSTLLDVPEDAAYRVSLRHQVGMHTPCPVTLTLTPQKAAGPSPADTNRQVYADAGPGVSHVFGQLVLADGMTGKQQEKKLPVRFETETQRIASPSEAMLVWEHWDVEIKKGVYRAALAGAGKQARASALLLSRSKDFRPSLCSFPKDRTLGRIYMRFRATDPAAKPGAKFAVNAGLGYHWRGRRAPGSTEDAWAWGIGKTEAAALGEWSPFVEATDAVIPGPGPWSTCNLGFEGASSGEVEVQLAWYPHERAVLQSQKTSISGGRAMLRVPNGPWAPSPQSGVPAWGMWSEARVKEIMTAEAVIERYFTWARQAAQRLGLKDGHPRPKEIRLFCGCGVLPADQARAAEMLAELGVNWIDGAPASVIKKFGLHDELCAYNTADPAAVARGMSKADRKRMTKIKIGDEIGTLTPAAEINGDVAKRAAFHDYLKEQARLEGMDMPAFLGVKDLGDIECIGRLPANPGRYERRLFYHSQRFGHLVTCDEYRQITRGFERVFPNVHVYNNYSPHPVFLTGTTMNESDWFVLPRHQAQTLGWAEDWATWGGWGLNTAYQCTSFYAALVDCAVRKHGYPAGFYVGSNCGGSAEKIFGCVAEGLTWLHLYDWGPIDRWAEGSNAWSENESEYYAVMCAACAIGPADEIIGKGRRERRRTAILYNRSHEIIHEGLGRLNHDWMWTFIALKSSQVPVDVIIEEDINPDDLKRYDCVFVGGFNLAKRHVGELKRWVEAGGLLIGTGGAAMADVYDDVMPETVELFGARQKMVGPGETGAVARVSFAATDAFPAAEFAPGGPAFLLTPTTGKSLATYKGGQCAATANAVGKGQAILLGFQPGATYRDNKQAAGPARAWLAAPVLKRLGRQRVEFDHPSSEVTLFEHDSGLAVMLASFGGPSPEGGSRLSVQTDRPVKEVLSALHGPLEWKRANDRIEIKTRRLESVDVVILR